MLVEWVKRFTRKPKPIDEHRPDPDVTEARLRVIFLERRADRALKHIA